MKICSARLRSRLLFRFYPLIAFNPCLNLSVELRRGSHQEAIIQFQSLADRSKGPNGDTKYTIMVSVKISRFWAWIAPARARVSEKVHHLITGGPEDEAWRTDVTDQCTAETPSEGGTGCERRSNLERNTTEEEIGGWKAPALLENCRWVPHKWRFGGCYFGVPGGLYGRCLQWQSQADPDWISYFQFRRLRSGPLKCFNSFRLLVSHQFEDKKKQTCYGVPLS